MRRESAGSLRIGPSGKEVGMPVERETMDVKMQRRLQEDALGKDIIDSP